MMPQTRTISFRNYDKNLLITAGLFLVFVLGMIYGVLICARNTDNLNFLNFMMTENYLMQSDSSFLYNLLHSFWSVFLFMILPYLLGYSAIFQPVILAVPFIKGLNVGLFMSNMYLNYKFQGIVFCLIVVLAPTVIALFAIIIECREAVRLSSMFFKSFASKNEFSVKRETIKIYNVKMGVLLLIAFCGALLSSILSLLFSNVFNF